MQASYRPGIGLRKNVGDECGGGGGRQRRALRTVRLMTAPLSNSLADAERDLRTAQSEIDPHRQGQYARSAADGAAEVAVAGGTDSDERERAVSLMDSALTLAARALLREAKSHLADARAAEDPQRRRELARSAVSKARQASRQRDLTDDERAEARQAVGHGRMLASSVGASVRRQRRAERDRGRDEPGIAI